MRRDECGLSVDGRRAFLTPFLLTTILAAVLRVSRVSYRDHWARERIAPKAVWAWRIPANHIPPEITRFALWGFTLRQREPLWTALRVLEDSRWGQREALWHATLGRDEARRVGDR